jgi:DNA-directed RNA polymerase specialized sigma24 family protein
VTVGAKLVTCYCGTVVAARRSLRRFCSKKCALADWHRRRRGGPPARKPRAPGPPRPDREHEAAAELELLAGFGRVPRTGLRLAEWRRVLRVLEPRSRRVVVLRLFHGMTDAAAGERVGVTKERARQVWHRALKVLGAGLLRAVGLCAGRGK